METRLPLLVKRLSQTARLPSKGSKLAAGYDLYSSEETVIPARGKGLVKTGISIAVPTGNYGRVAPRSGLAVKNFIDVGAGVIDEDYRGEVGVVLFNHAEVDFKVALGDRIAQLIIEKITDTIIEEVDNLDQTARGAGGFGSTGVASEADTKMEIVTTTTTQPQNLKRKSPYGALLAKDLIENAREDIADENDWKEWAVLVLYTLCESGIITLDEKRSWANLIFANERKAYEILRNNMQASDFSKVRDALNALVQ